MKTYSDNGYVNVKGILAEGYPFNFLIGGRGTGKTYTTLKESKEDGQRFMLLRRTQTEADIISKPEFSVFKPLNDDLGWNVCVERISKYNSMFYEPDGEERKIIGYTGALSTIANMRGFDASDIKRLIFDEFIPEKHVRILKNEAEALFNAYETMNRNRELKGIEPIQLVCLANSNDITNPVFEYLKLIRIADKMQKGNCDRWTDDRRGIQLILLHRSPISRRKANTALYRLTDDTNFSAMSIDNDFRVDRSHVNPRPLKEYTPVCSVGELCIYRHKSEPRLYATTHMSGVFNKQYTLSDTDRIHYQRIYRSQWDMYISGRIDFEDVLAEKMFIKYWEMVNI